MRLTSVSCAVVLAGSLLASVHSQVPVQNAGTKPASDKIIGGTVAPAKADERGWGWQVKAMMNPATPRPLYNRAKERLLQDKQIKAAGSGITAGDAQSGHDYSSASTTPSVL